MSLTDSEQQEVDDRSELVVRRYFDHYLQEVLPEQLKAGRAHTHQMIEKHDADRDAHDGVERKMNRIIWLSLGAGLVSGAGGVIGLRSLLSAIGGG